MLAPARFERTIAVVAGLALASCAFRFGSLRPADLFAYLLVSPPFVTGALAAGIAMTSRPRVRQGLITAIDVLMTISAVAWGALGTLLLVLPGVIVISLFAGWFRLSRRGDPEERGARVVLATGAVWSFVFGLASRETGARGVQVSLAASLALAFAGLAWLRTILRTRRERDEPARALLYRPA